MDTPSDTGYDGKDSHQHPAARPARSTGRPTWPSGRRATSTSRTATATAASTASRPRGELKQSWGEPGNGPGQFNLPARRRGGRRRPRLRLRPRERPHPDLQPRRRVPRGVDRHPAPDPHRVRRRRAAPTSPSCGGTRARSRSATAPSTTPRPAGSASSTATASVLARWGSADATAPGSFAAPHGLAVDSQGDIYVRRGHLDLRGEPRARPRGLPHVPEVRAEEVAVAPDGRGVLIAAPPAPRSRRSPRGSRTP